MEISIYCDESCHLQYDKNDIMLFGAIWLDESKKAEVFQRIKQIKYRYDIPSSREIKWTKISCSKLNLYEDLVNYFFDNDDIHFRCLVVRNKSFFNATKFGHSFDDMYFKSYFYTLNNILYRNNTYKIYIDIKDTNSKPKLKRLTEILSNSNYDFQHKMIKTMQNVRSHEIQTMQLTDILLGAVSYKLRGHSKSIAKNTIIQIIEDRANLTWNKSSYARDDKFNIFYLDLINGEHHEHE